MAEVLGHEIWSSDAARDERELLVVAGAFLGGLATDGALALVLGLVRWKVGPELAFDAHPFLTLPCFTIWTHPGATLRRALANDSLRGAVVLCSCAAIFNAWDKASFRSLGDELSLPTILGGGIVCGSLAGIAGLFVGAALFRWVGSLLGGRGSYRQVVEALACPQWIGIWLGLLWIPFLLLFGHEMFTTETPRLDASSWLRGATIWLGTVEIAGAIWSFVVLVRCLGVAHDFAWGKALLTLLIPWAIVLFLAVTCFGAAFLVGRMS
jgi:hypothetical protein